MAICRGLVYITAITAFSTPYTFALVIFCGAIGIYTSLLTFIGSSEHDGQLKHSWLVWATLIPALIPALLFGPESPITWFTFIAFAGWIYVAWHHFVASSNNVISGMHTLLSGFALLDCLLIASLGEYYIMLTSAICFVLTIAAQRKILGT
jgi:hypothetical protein